MTQTEHRDVKPKTVDRSLRWRWLWIVVILVNWIGLKVMQEAANSEIGSQFMFATFLTTALVAAPFIRFLTNTWKDRYEEFRNRLTDGFLNAYLLQFWEPRVRKVAPEILDRKNLNSFAAAEELFDIIYKEQYGQGVFVVPFLLLLLSTFATSCLVIKIGLDGFQLSAYDRTVSISAIAGAYMFAVGDLILNVRRKSLNVADVYWYVLRLILAIPIGSSVAATVPTAMQGLVAFGLGTFPVDTLTKLIRRLTAKPLNVSETDQAPDLIKLEGVSVPIASTLSAEGADSIEQILGMDPILLAIRTGLPFKFVLQLGSQAVVRRHLGDSASRLIAIDLIYAQQITSLIKAIDEQNDPMAERVLADATARLQDSTNPSQLSTDSVKFMFRNIASDSYTRFLLNS